MRLAGFRGGQLGTIILLVALAHACVRPTHRVFLEHPPEAGAVLAALAARERVMRSLRVSMTLRTPGMSPAALISSRAYLATESPDTLRLQVLSPFGTTTLGLTIEGDRYELHLPLRAEVKRGNIAPEALTAPDAPEFERMVIALALLFRPKVSEERCSRGQGAAVTCLAGEGLAATVTVDEHLRPLRESYAGADGTPVLSVEYGEYGTSEPTALPGRIEIRDETTGTAMVARIVHFRTGAVETAR